MRERKAKWPRGPSPLSGADIPLRLIGQSTPQAQPEIEARSCVCLVHVLGDVRLFDGRSERGFRHQLYRRSARVLRGFVDGGVDGG